MGIGNTFLLPRSLLKNTSLTLNSLLGEREGCELLPMARVNLLTQ